MGIAVFVVVVVVVIVVVAVVVVAVVVYVACARTHAMDVMLYAWFTDLSRWYFWSQPGKSRLAWRSRATLASMERTHIPSYELSP